MILAWTQQAWDDYLYWQKQDRKTLKRINTLIYDTLRHPREGLGKPEHLKWDIADGWSRRIDTYNRLTYLITDDEVRITAARNHYR